MEDLKSLIHAMTAREQRYFREFAQRHTLKGQNKYLALFEAIVAEQADLSGFRQLPALTNYLKKLVLRALRAYHYQDSIGMELRSYLDFLEILHEKQQLSLARRTAEKGMRKAAEAGMPGLELEFSVWLRRLRRNTRPARSEALARQQEPAENAASEALVASIRCLHVYDQVFWHTQQRMLLPGQSSEAATHLAEHPALQGPPPSAFDGAILYHSAKGSLAQLKGQTEEALHHFRENLQVWNRFPPRIEAHPTRFSATIMNYLSACHQAGRYQEYQEVLRNFLDNPQLSARVQDRILGKCLDFELVLYLNTSQPEPAALAAQKLTDFLGKQSLPVRLRLGIHYNLAMYHFVQESWSDCLRHLNTIQDAPFPQTRQDLRDQSRLFELVLHFELGNEALLPYRMRSLRRNYRKMKLPGWTPTFLTALQTLLRTWQAADRLPIYRKLQAALQEGAAREAGSGAQEILLWVISKVNYQSLNEAWLDGFKANR